MEQIELKVTGMTCGGCENAVKRAVDEHSRSRTDAFFFNLPVLYWLHAKIGRAHV